MPIESLDSQATDVEEIPWLSASTLFESAAWRRVIKQTYGFSFYHAHDGVSASLPFAVTKSQLRPRVVSLPFSDYVTTDSLGPATYRDLTETVREAHPGHPLVLKTTFPHDTEGLGAVTRKSYYHRVPTPSHEEVDGNMKSSFRNKMRQARRANVRVERTTSAEAMGGFYDLHRSLRFGKFGKIPQPRRFFREIRREFLLNENGFVMQATRGGEVIAALVALRHRDVLYYKFSASAKKHLEHRPNNLLMHALLHHAVEQDLEAVDLGLSGAGPSYKGLRRFKESLGGQPRPVTRFRLDPPNYDDAAERELNNLLGNLSEAVVDHELDVEATDAFSERLYPFFA
jgi:hypothetical protein